MVKIIKSIIAKGQTKQRPGLSMNPSYITVHNTANNSKGADAEMHSRYLHNGGGGRSVGWHFTVDDTVIYQHLPTDESAYHAGDGGNGTGNRQSIGIEICENSDGDFNKAVSNAQWLIKKLMKDHNIGIGNVVPHKHWSGKQCPHLLLGQWDSFIDGIQGSSGSTTTKPSKQDKPTQNTSKPNPSGNLGLVDYMVSKKLDSSMANRKKLAAKYGIKNYSGTAGQNTKLLSKIKGGKPASTTGKPKAKYPLPTGVYSRKKHGNKSLNAVKQIQRALNAAYFKVGKVDGYYGSKTEDAVRRFQSVYVASEVDSVYGNNTRKALNKKVN